MNGPVVWVVWALEAVLVLGAALQFARTASTPYCECCGRWTQERPPRFLQRDRSDAEPLLAQGKLAELLALEHRPLEVPDAPKIFLTRHDCPSCTNTSFLTIAAITYWRDKGELKSSEAVLDRNLVLSAKLRADFDDRFGREPMEIPTPRLEASAASLPTSSGAGSRVKIGCAVALIAISVVSLLAFWSVLPDALAFLAGGLNTPGNLEAFARGCDQGVRENCYSAGVVARDGDFLPAAERAQRAAVFFEAGCSAGDLASCDEGGALYLEMKNDVADARAVRMFELACHSDDEAGWGFEHFVAGGRVSACTNLGDAYVAGRGVSAEPTLAARAYARGCEFGRKKPGWAFPCESAAKLALDGIGGEKDEVRAAQLFEIACDDGAPLACASLSSLAKAGRGTPMDPQRAARLRQRTCELVKAAGFDAKEAVKYCRE